MLNVSKSTAKKSATASKAKASPSTLKEPETLAPATQETIAQPVETTNAQEDTTVSVEQQSTPETMNEPNSSNNSDTKAPAKLARTERSAVVKGVALPPASRGTGGGKSKYGWEDMEPGDAFFVPDAKVETFYTLISSAKKKTGKNFTSRKLADGAIFGEQYAGKPGVGVWCVPNE